MKRNIVGFATAAILGALVAGAAIFALTLSARSVAGARECHHLLLALGVEAMHRASEGNDQGKGVI